MKRIFTKGQRNSIATIGGLMNTLILAVVCIDFDKFDASSTNEWVKLFAVLSPAICGYFSELSGKSLNDETKS